jgi:hypothetical protein
MEMLLTGGEASILDTSSLALKFVSRRQGLTFRGIRQSICGVTRRFFIRSHIHRSL